MMMWIRDYELTQLEHDFIKEQNAFDFDPNRFQWYMMGVHDFVERLIKKMKEEEGAN